MSDLSQTPGNVKLVAGTAALVGTAGEALTQGQPAYEASGKWYRCDANDTAAKANCRVIVLTPAATDEQVVLARAGSDVNLGATLTVGTVYVVSANVGAIAPVADLTTNDYVTILGVAKTAAVLAFSPVVSGVQKA
jgi:hypothetical protein